MNDESEISAPGLGPSQAEPIRAWLARVLTFMLIMLLDVVVVVAIGWLTQSSPVGICGPVGSDTAVDSMLALLGLGPLVAGVGAFYVGRQVSRAHRGVVRA